MRIAVFLSALGLLTGTTSVVLGNYVYQLAPVTLVDNSGTSFYTVTGTIVTDVNSGALSASDIISWQWTATDGTSAFSLSSSSPLTFAEVNGSVVATPSEIYMAWEPDPFETHDQFELTTPFVPANSEFTLNYFQVYEHSGQGHLQMAELYDGSTGVSWLQNLGGGSNFVPPPAVIATAVPEPSALILAALNGLALLVIRRRRVTAR